MDKSFVNRYQDGLGRVPCPKEFGPPPFSCFARERPVGLHTPSLSLAVHVAGCPRPGSSSLLLLLVLPLRCRLFGSGCWRRPAGSGGRLHWCCCLHAGYWPVVVGCSGAAASAPAVCADRWFCWRRLLVPTAGSGGCCRLRGYPCVGSWCWCRFTASFCSTRCPGLARAWPRDPWLACGKKKGKTKVCPVCKSARCQAPPSKTALSKS